MSSPRPLPGSYLQFLNKLHNTLHSFRLGDLKDHAPHLVHEDELPLPGRYGAFFS